MKFCKWVIEKNNHFIELNRTSFLILWHWGAEQFDTFTTVILKTL